MMERPLDIDAVRTFVHIAQLGSFTRAAEAMGTTQAAVSLKLKRLEERLGCRLMERTPRHVHLSAQGTAFLEHARELLSVHDRTFTAFTKTRERIVIGISDHVAGPDLPTLICRMNQQDPHRLIEVHIGSSADLLQRYDRREFDAVIVRFENEREDGDILATEKLGWFAASDWKHHSGHPLPLVIMPEPCGVRRLAQAWLDKAGLPWTEVFVGGGVATVSAAVTAKLGVAALVRRMLPLGVVDVGADLGLPELPRLPIVLYSRVETERGHRLIRELSAAFRHSVRD